MRKKPLPKKSKGTGPLPPMEKTLKPLPKKKGKKSY